MGKGSREKGGRGKNFGNCVYKIGMQIRGGNRGGGKKKGGERPFPRTGSRGEKVGQRGEKKKTETGSEYFRAYKSQQGGKRHSVRGERKKKGKE